MRFILIENHPNDSRVNLKEDEICQSLTGRMGTGGGNIPLVLILTESKEELKTETITKHG